MTGHAKEGAWEQRLRHPRRPHKIKIIVREEIEDDGTVLWTLNAKTYDKTILNAFSILFDAELEFKTNNMQGDD